MLGVGTFENAFVTSAIVTSPLFPWPFWILPETDLDVDDEMKTHFFPSKNGEMGGEMGE